MMRGFLKNRCTRCGGNLYLERDESDWYEECFLCSRITYMATIFDRQQVVDSRNTKSKKAIKLIR